MITQRHGESPGARDTPDETPVAHPERANIFAAALKKNYVIPDREREDRSPTRAERHTRSGERP